MDVAVAPKIGVDRTAAGIVLDLLREPVSRFAQLVQSVEYDLSKVCLHGPPLAWNLSRMVATGVGFVSSGCVSSQSEREPS